MIGVYAIINLSNWRMYIGSGVHIPSRFGTHLGTLRKGQNHNRYLQEAWDKEGEGNFCFTLLEECSRETLREREQYWLDNVEDKYNISPSSQDGTYAEEHKRRIAQSRVGIPRTEETKRKLSESLKGRKREFSEEHRRNLSEAGKRRSKAWST